MDTFICTGVSNDCQNPASYGMICVGCNQCLKLGQNRPIILDMDGSMMCPVCKNEGVKEIDNFCGVCGNRLVPEAALENRGDK